ncbi:unnamed protein product [Phytophthora fragariaefolia]|uniref:Unnamed protein product n=1 Tax=Phytophthora fragariaefolia TaxID=1490495 RepID=A0A9W6XXI3_9STRA|nr:unnamed protein product [Phytophthora fragariaefolia]
MSRLKTRRAVEDISRNLRLRQHPRIADNNMDQCPTPGQPATIPSRTPALQGPSASALTSPPPQFPGHATARVGTCDAFLGQLLHIRTVQQQAMQLQQQQFQSFMKQQSNI